MATTVAPAKGAKKGKSAGSGAQADLALAAPATATPDAGELRPVRVGLVDPSPYQPRTTFDDAELQQLADSMRAQGLLQPVVVRFTGTEHRERYELVAGERRLRAAKRLGWECVPALVKRMSDEAAAANAAIENLQRAQLTPLEEAEAYARLMREQGWTQQQLAERLGVPRSTVGDRVRVLTLPAVWLDLIRDGNVVQLSHAPILLAYKAAPDAVHAGAVERFKRSHNWTGAVAASKPIEVAQFVSVAYHAYSLDLWPLSRIADLGGAYEGPSVTVSTFHGVPAERFAADPAVWLPLREAEKARTQIGVGSPAAAAERAAAAPVLVGAHRNRPLRPDVVLALPAGHGAPVERTGYGYPAGVAVLTDEDGRWDDSQHAPFDPADLVLDPASLVEVRDTHFGARRVGTTDLAAVERAQDAWAARWEARRAELARGQARPVHLEGAGVPTLLAFLCEQEDEALGLAVCEVADAAGLTVPDAVRDECGEEARTYPGHDTAAWLKDRDLAFQVSVASAWLARVTQGDHHARAVAQREENAAWEAIVAQPVPWVAARPKLLSDESRGLFVEEPAADEDLEAEGDDDGE